MSIMPELRPAVSNSCLGDGVDHVVVSQTKEFTRPPRTDLTYGDLKIAGITTSHPAHRDAPPTWGWG